MNGVIPIPPATISSGSAGSLGSRKSPPTVVAWTRLPGGSSAKVRLNELEPSAGILIPKLTVPAALSAAEMENTRRMPRESARRCGTVTSMY